MGDGRQRQPLDKTNPSKLSKPGTYQDRAVHTGGTPVESPNANAVRTVRTINSILEPFVPKTTNLPAVIPASRNANKVVASQTIQPSQRLDQFIEGQIPGGRQFGKQRAKLRGNIEMYSILQQNVSIMQFGTKLLEIGRTLDMKKSSLREVLCSSYSYRGICSTRRCYERP